MFYLRTFVKLLQIDIAPLVLNLDSTNLHQITCDVSISDHYNTIQAFPCINYFYVSAYFFFLRNKYLTNIVAFSQMAVFKTFFGGL